jgi:hypothetical protein
MFIWGLFNLQFKCNYSENKRQYLEVAYSADMTALSLFD